MQGPSHKVGDSHFVDQLDRGYVHASIGLSMELAVYYQPAGGLTIVARIGGVVLDKTSQSSFCCFSKRGELVVRAEHAPGAIDWSVATWRCAPLARRVPDSARVGGRNQWPRCLLHV